MYTTSYYTSRPDNSVQHHADVDVSSEQRW